MNSAFRALKFKKEYIDKNNNELNGNQTKWFIHDKIDADEIEIAIVIAINANELQHKLFSTSNNYYRIWTENTIKTTTAASTTTVAVAVHTKKKNVQIIF